jgi:G3E family GTPase
LVDKTKIVIISGFLGSGKTTLLKRLVDWEFNHGRQPRVIMSEFGDFDVDGKILADERLQVSSVVGGCICCSNRNELFDTLNLIVKKTPGGHVFIETTGVGDPAGVLQAVAPLAGPAVNINKILVVYDASQHGAEGQDKILIEKQLMTSDIIILNKTDLTDHNIGKIKSDVAGINPLAEIVPAVQCEIDIAKALEGETACFVTEEHIDTASAYRSFAFKLEPRLVRSSFETWLKTLPPEVVRLKGFVRFAGESGIFEVQVSRGQNIISPFNTLRWMDATLVVISHPLPAEKILNGLKACISPNQ